MKDNYIQEDEIDLKELFQILWNKKIFIAVFTFIVTISAIGYVLLKNPIPLYKGSVVVEIGEIQSESFGRVNFDNSNDLSEILHINFNVDSILPKGTTKLIEISFISSDKNEIKYTLEKSIEFILNRHQEKAKFYKHSIMTQEIGNIKIGNDPVNKLKILLIVPISFIIGFILSIFIVFFMQFIQNFRGEKND